jgi:uncharacterized protein (TIGR02246 family)
MSNDEQAIRDLVALWHSATARGDVDTILGLMAEDVVFLVVGKEPMRGRRAFEQSLRALLEQYRIESSGEIQEIEVSGNLAYSWCKLKVQIIPLSAGPSPVREGSTLSILRKESEGSWVIVRDANLLTAST